MGDGSAELERVARELRQLEKKVERPLPIWPRIGSRIARMNRTAFATRGASTGSPWRPLAASTMAEKLKSGFGRSPLVRSGGMKSGFTSRPMAIEHYFGRNAVYGSDSQIAVWQQGGTHRHGRLHIPPRLIQHLTPAVRKEIRDIIVKYILKG